MAQQKLLTLGRAPQQEEQREVKRRDMKGAVKSPASGAVKQYGARAARPLLPERRRPSSVRKVEARAVGNVFGPPRQLDGTEQAEDAVLTSVVVYPKVRRESAGLDGGAVPRT